MQYSKSGHQAFYTIQINGQYTETLTVDLPNSVEFEYDSELFEGSKSRVKRLNSLWLDFYQNSQTINDTNMGDQSQIQTMRKIFFILLNGHFFTCKSTYEKKCFDKLMNMRNVQGMNLIFYVLEGQQCSTALLEKILQERNMTYNDCTYWLNQIFSQVNESNKTSVESILGYCLQGFQYDFLLHDTLRKYGACPTAHSALHYQLDMLSNYVDKMSTPNEMIIDFLSHKMSVDFTCWARSQDISDDDEANINMFLTKFNVSHNTSHLGLHKLISSLKDYFDDIFLDARVVFSESDPSNMFGVLVVTEVVPFHRREFNKDESNTDLNHQIPQSMMMHQMPEQLMPNVPNKINLDDQVLKFDSKRFNNKRFADDEGENVNAYGPNRNKVKEGIESQATSSATKNNSGQKGYLSAIHEHTKERYPILSATDSDSNSRDDDESNKNNNIAMNNRQGNSVNSNSAESDEDTARHNHMMILARQHRQQQRQN